MKNYYLIIVILFLGNLLACQDHVLEKDIEEKNGFNEPVKINNPYSVENMQNALDSVKIEWKGRTKTASTIEGVEIKATNYYVKIMPSSSEEEGLLKQDTTLYLFDYPLDYEFTDEYLDNRAALKEGEFPIYYTYIAVDKNMPNVPYEILDELYNPDADPYFEDEVTSTKAGYVSEKEKLLTSLLRKSFSLTGNENEFVNEDESKTKVWIFGSKWYPSGNIQIWDDDAGQSTVMERVFSHWEYVEVNEGEPSEEGDLRRLDEDRVVKVKRPVYKYVPKQIQGKYVPLEGAQVLIRQLFTIHNATTDANGNFKAGKTRGKARYIIQWERKHYSIRNEGVFQAETRGPNVKKQEWNLKIKGGDDEYHGIIHSAAYTYYYKRPAGLTSPPTNATFKRQMKIAAREKNGISSHIHQRRHILGAQIYIKKWGASSEEVYGTTIHELAHAAHWNLDKSSYNNLVEDSYISDFVLNDANIGDYRLLESWATTVEICLTVNRYKNQFNQKNYTYKENYQNLSVFQENKYTSAGYDMIDDYNQQKIYGSSYPNDKVKDYALWQLNSALVGASSWNQWRDNIKDMYSNSTEQYLDELFASWE